MTKRKRPSRRREAHPLWSTIPNPSGLENFDNAIERTKNELVFCKKTGAVLRDGKVILVPTAIQKSILKALRGRCLKRALAAKLGCNGNEFHRNGDIQHLKQLGLVASRRTGGYFLPDDPPADAIRKAFR